MVAQLEDFPPIRCTSPVLSSSRPPFLGVFLLEIFLLEVVYNLPTWFLRPTTFICVLNRNRFFFTAHQFVSLLLRGSLSRCAACPLLLRPLLLRGLLHAMRLSGGLYDFLAFLHDLQHTSLTPLLPRLRRSSYGDLFLSPKYAHCKIKLRG